MPRSKLGGAKRCMEMEIMPCRMGTRGARARAARTVRHYVAATLARSQKAIWRGTGRAGNGNLSTDSGVLANTPYSFRTRFENENGTNPESRRI